MGSVIVIQFITLDGVVEDPDGSDGTDFGGWAMRFGVQAIAGDKFRLGSILDDGTLLFGRRTWEHFSTLWPTRSDPFAMAMNRARKHVVSRRPLDPAQWSGSRQVDRPLIDWIDASRPTTDIAVIGSASVVAELAAHDRVDEYRLLTFPTATGAGRRLFPAGVRAEVVSCERSGPGVLSVLMPERTSHRAVGA